jgi:uncharacterized protein (TIGR02147 family)
MKTPARPDQPLPGELLRRFLARKQEFNPSYSLRALSRDLGLSVSYVSGVLRDQKPFPTARFDQIADKLGMDDLAKGQLSQAILRLSLQKSASELPARLPALDSEPTSRKRSERSAVLKYIEASQREYQALDRWYTIALLDLVSCKGFTPDPAWISRRLGITPHEAEASWRYLLEHKLVALGPDGSYRKTKYKMRFPTSRSLGAVRAYHRQMIGLALQELQLRTDAQSFERRLITGITFASNPRNLKKAQRRLSEALYEISEILSQGECTELYQLNAQLFALTRNQSIPTQ